MEFIVLVEDDPDNAELLLDYFDGDFKITHYESAVVAWEAVLKGKMEKPNLFLLDISMPMMDGIELLKKLKSRNEFKNTPMVALTAHAMKEDAERFLSEGFDAYFEKPILDFEELRELMEKHSI